MFPSIRGRHGLALYGLLVVGFVAGCADDSGDVPTGGMGTSTGGDGPSNGTVPDSGSGGSNGGSQSGGNGPSRDVDSRTPVELCQGNVTSNCDDYKNQQACETRECAWTQCSGDRGGCLRPNGLYYRCSDVPECQVRQRCEGAYDLNGNACASWGSAYECEDHLCDWSTDCTDLTFDCDTASDSSECVDGGCTWGQTPKCGGRHPECVEFALKACEKLPKGCRLSTAYLTNCDSTGSSCVCPTGTVNCGQYCFDLTQDNAHCGACGNTCAPGDECRDSQCVPIDVCAAELDNCDENATCMDGEGDDFSCACLPGFDGDGVTCADIDECSVSSIACSNGGTCTNLAGSYECTCPAGYDYVAPDQCVLVNECQAGLLDGLKWCTDSCVDPLSDLFNCGDCDQPCPVGGSCDDGDCSCPSELGNCVTKCAELSSDEEFCGACDVHCARGATCESANCVCPGATPIVCDDVCRDGSNDPEHCGACDNRCAWGATCIDGTCACTDAGADATCPSPSCTPQDIASGLCAYSCTDLDTDTTNCGTCGHACTTPCGSGQCLTAVDLVAGDTYYCARMSDGSVYCWGRSLGAEGGPYVSGSYSVPFSSGSGAGYDALAAGSKTLCVIDDGTLSCRGDLRGLPGFSGAVDTLTVVATDVTLVASGKGQMRTCYATQAGPVKCFGSFVTLAEVAGISNVDALAVGGMHSCALKAGAVYCWGDNWYGQLGQGHTTAVDGVVQVPGLSSVTALSAAYNTTCALLSSGGIRCWGDNAEGQVGNGSTAAATSPAAAAIAGATSVVTGKHSCASRSTGAPRCWGRNAEGQLGDGTTVRKDQPTASPTGSASFTKFAVSSIGTCAIDTAGDIWCWGGDASAGAQLLTPKKIGWWYVDGDVP